MCNCNCEFCADNEECEISYFCSKLNKFCIARKECIKNDKIPKMLGCFKQLKQQELFDLTNHNQ